MFWFFQLTCKSDLKLVQTTRNDLFAVNDNGNFQRILQDIYPKEMIVSNTNISNSKCSYLDLLISVYQGKFKVNLYDKRDGYKF